MPQTQDCNAHIAISLSEVNSLSVPTTTRSEKVLITTVPFGQSDPAPINALTAAGLPYLINPLGRRLTPPELCEMIGDISLMVAGTEPITSQVMAAAPHLRLIARVGIGLDNVDLGEARRRGIAVSYTPDAPSPAVAELTIGLVLSLLRDIPNTDHRMHRGVWQRSQGRRISHSTIGIIGVGRIGRKVIRHLQGGFPGVRILAHDVAPDLAFGDTHGVTWVDKDTLLADADVVSLHVPLTRDTRYLIGQRELGVMRPTSVLINTSRGGIVDEVALAGALREGRLHGAAVDVFEQEPYAGELTAIDRCLLTSHMGSMSADCRAQMERESVDEVVRFAAGKPLRTPVPESEYPE